MKYKGQINMEDKQKTCLNAKCPERFSVCCGARADVSTSDEGTSYYICAKCGKEFISDKCTSGDDFNPQEFADIMYKFLKDMKFGERSNDVLELQKRLIDMGYAIPAGKTGYYGNETKKAVSIYQYVAGVPLSWYEKYVLAGSVCGAKTRQRLNAS